MYIYKFVIFIKHFVFLDVCIRFMLWWSELWKNLTVDAKKQNFQKSQICESSKMAQAKVQYKWSYPCDFTNDIHWGERQTETVTVSSSISVPGDAGSQIFARLPKTDSYCGCGNKWFRVWIKLSFFLECKIYCLSKYFA